MPHLDVVKPPTMVTTIRIPPEVWAMLRRLSEARALECGGRPNASATVADLVKAAAGRKDVRVE